MFSPLRLFYCPNSRRCLITIIASAVLAACQSVPENQTDDAPTQASVVTIVSTNSDIPDAEASDVLAIEAIIEAPPGETHYSDLWVRLHAGFQLQGNYNHPSVISRAETYAGNQRYFDLVSQRAAPFLFSIVEEIERRGLPLELALVPIVESTFNPNAYSQEHAVGLWQFVGATGSSFGLQQDWWYDGRRDPLASTVAALDYLQILYDQFDQNWLLALAAYNTGDGNLRRAIRRNEQEDRAVDFWELPLARETRSHIPKILALAKIISNSQAFDIELPPLANSQSIEAVEVGAQIDLSKAATLAGLDYDELRSLNPGYRQWATHPDHPQRLFVPMDKASQLRSALLNSDRQHWLSWDRYEINPGDTLGGIAQKLNTRVDILRTVNQIQGNQIIAGRSLLIPRGQNSGNLDELTSLPLMRALPASVPSSYRIRSGDNLWSIARRYDLKSADIADWNEIDRQSILRPGQILDFSFAQSNKELDSEIEVDDSLDTYLVRRGDSMAKIARRFNTRLEDLLSWNNMSATQIIYPGQAIHLPQIKNGLN